MSEKALSWAFCDEVVEESAVVSEARARAAEIACPTPSASVGNFLGVVCNLVKATSAVCVGTGAGITGLYLLQAMPENGTITTIDSDPEHLHAARQTFTNAKVRPSRSRFMTGNGAEFLSRLSDATYHVVVLSSTGSDLPEQVQQALRILHPTGALVVLNALLNDQVSNPAQRDERTTMMRQVITDLMENPDLQTSLLPLGAGILLATHAA